MIDILLKQTGLENCSVDDSREHTTYDDNNFALGTQVIALVIDSHYTGLVYKVISGDYDHEDMQFYNVNVKTFTYDPDNTQSSQMDSKLWNKAYDHYTDLLNM